MNVRNRDWIRTFVCLEEMFMQKSTKSHNQNVKVGKAKNVVPMLYLNKKAEMLNLGLLF